MPAVEQRDPHSELLCAAASPSEAQCSAAHLTPVCAG